MTDDLPADLPIRRERIAILARETAGLRHEEDVDLDLLAAVTCGFSAAELITLCRYARDNTAGSEPGSISMVDFSDAVDACLRDGSRPLFLEPYPRLIAAYEVAGQALVGLRMWGVQPAGRITILPDQPGDPFSTLPHDVSSHDGFFASLDLALAGAEARQLAGVDLSTADEPILATELAGLYLAAQGVATAAVEDQARKLVDARRREIARELGEARPQLERLAKMLVHEEGIEPAEFAALLSG